MFASAFSAPVIDDPELVAELVLEHFMEHQPEPTSFPLIASRVIDLAEHPTVDAGKLAHLIERDPAICAAVLGVANSAANRPAMPVESVRDSVARLGLKRVADIAVGTACRSLFDVEVRVQRDVFPGWWERLFHAAMTEAFTCAFSAMQHTGRHAEGVFLMALLHDLGKSLGLRSLAALVVRGELAPPDFDTIEEALEINNCTIGALAAERFNLPERIVDICRHQYDESLDPYWAEAHVIRVVGNMNSLRMGTLYTEHPVRLMLNSADALGLGTIEVMEIAAHLSEQSSQVSSLFSTEDDADEAGFFDFVSRCLAG